jgi:hypothetical protein
VTGIDADSLADDLTDPSDEGRNLTNQIEILQANKQTVNLDSAAFKITGLRVAVEEKILNHVPVVFFMPVPIADFYQLMRCDADANIQGPFSSLQSVEISAASQEEEVRSQIENRFWSVAENHEGCVKISDSMVRTVYYDADLSDGSYKYLARACTLDAVQQIQCSSIVSLSTELPNYRNESSAWSAFMLEEIAQSERAIEELSLQLAKLSQEYATNIVMCEKETKIRALASQRKSFLATVIGMGAQIGAHLILNPFSTPLEAASSVWNSRADLAAQSKPLTGLLKDMFITEADAQLNCPETEAIAREAQTVLLEIEGLKRTIDGFAREEADGGQP